MDKNKLKVLETIDYEIPRTCGLCANADIKPGQDFGVCTVQFYAHGKHTVADRQLSIYRGGFCWEDFEMSKEAKARLGDWARFVF